MSIQSNINQMISLASILSSQTEGYKTKQEAKRLGKKERALTEARDIAAKEGTGRGTKMAEQYQEQIQEVKKAQFENAPSAQGLREIEDLERPVATIQEEPEEIAKQRFEAEEREREVNDFLDQYRKASQTARNALEVKQAEKRDSRASFLDYLEEPTSLGGTVKDLDPKLRDLIADQLGDTWEFGKKGNER